MLWDNDCGCGNNNIVIRNNCCCRDRDRCGCGGRRRRGCGRRRGGRCNISGFFRVCCRRDWDFDGFGFDGRDDGWDCV